VIELTIRFENVDSEVLPRCIPGDSVKLWTKVGHDFIHFYARRSLGGQGRIARLHKDRVPVFNEFHASTTATISVVDGSTVVIVCMIDDEVLPF
jgi:hypothetical protein